MGRLRIKKKESVIPFRDTLAYRMLLSAVSIAFLMATIYYLMKYVSSGYTTGMIVSAGAAVMAATAVFYNLGQIKNARVSPSAMKRARRR